MGVQRNLEVYLQLGSDVAICLRVSMPDKAGVCWLPQAVYVKRLGQILGRLSRFHCGSHVAQDPLAKNIDQCPTQERRAVPSSDNAWRGSSDSKAPTINYRRPPRWTSSSTITVQTLRWEHSSPSNELTVAVIKRIAFSLLC